MAVGLVVGGSFYEIGEAALLHAFFSTISYNLEPRGWGTVYPLIMNDLYQGSLKWKKAEKAIDYIQKIREDLKRFSPDKVVWDIENFSKRPPWGDVVTNPEIQSLSNYFVTDDGCDMFDVFLGALTESIEVKKNLEISYARTFEG